MIYYFYNYCIDTTCRGNVELLLFFHFTFGVYPTSSYNIPECEISRQRKDYKGSKYTGINKHTPEMTTNAKEETRIPQTPTLTSSQGYS